LTTPSISETEETEVVYGAENIMNKTLQVFSKIKQRYDVCADSSGPYAFLKAEKLWNEYISLKYRGIRLRFLAEVTMNNISYCKGITKVAEFRHLDAVKANFRIGDGSVYAGITRATDGHVPTQIIFSEAKTFVEGQQYLFDTLWNKAIPAEQKIREFEQGLPPYETRIFKDPDEIIKRVSLLIERSNQLFTCVTPGGLQYSYKHFFEIRKKLVDKQKKGQHKGIKFISSIDNKYVTLANAFLDAGFQVRHIKNLPEMSFTFSDKEIAATIEKMEEGKNVQSLLVSNEPQYVEHFSNIFQELWEQGIDAKDIIRDIEEGRETDDELANAKRYVNKVVRVVRSMENFAVIES
jgi:two-component system, OmpR family, sensor histidine kinase VicK